MTMAQRVFISYSTKDYQKVRRIKDYLESVGIPCWMADEGIRSGEQFKTVIVKAIVKTDILVFFSSQASNASEWTTKEINTAVHLGKKIVPVKLDKAPYNESILFDIGALDYVDVSTVAKSVSGLAKLKDTLLTLLNNPATPDIPEPKPSHKRPHRALALGIAIGVILAGVVCGILLSLPPRVHKERTSDGNITYRIGHASFRMMRVRGGEFTMGSNYRESDQQYAHQVQLYTYYLGETEVTQELWEKVMGYNPSHRQEDKNMPVTNVSWLQCQEFIEQLNKMTGESFRLPTEAQWEYAARGGHNGTDTVFAGTARFSDIYSMQNERALQTVKSLSQPNRLGLYDMTGNVWEWCSDIYPDKPYSPERITNPQGASSGTIHIKRGGSWQSDSTECLVTFRGSADEKDSRTDYGLRLCLPE